MRFFVAVWPDEPTCRRLSDLERALDRGRGLRFVGESRWHVTLRFLGAADDSAVSRLGEALVGAAATHRDPVTCHLGPATAWFPEVRVLQVPASGVSGLAATVRTATERLVPAEAGEPPFNGHLTVARAKGRRLGPTALAETAGVGFTASFAVNHIDLVASRAAPGGHRYTTVVRAPLGSVGAGTPRA